MATIKLQKRDVSVSPVSTNRKPDLFSKCLTPTGVSFLLFILIVGTCFLYLSEFNNIASQGVIINDLERSRSELIIQNEVWNMRIARLKSLDVIEQQDVVKSMEFIGPEDLEFVDLDNREEESE
ncbi:MAG: hypothetical protein P1V18_04070 [Candidatus Gracilibacteria bacterium]|nr:hypothetical protein [Candidatus Gracilibacteria bacterium]